MPYSKFDPSPYIIFKSELEPFIDVYQRMNKVLTSRTVHGFFMYFENNNREQIMIVDDSGNPIISLPRNDKSAEYSNEDVLRYLVACENLIPLLLGRIRQLEKALTDSQSEYTEPILQELAEDL